MTGLGLAKALHLLGAVVWVGGMFFALLVLRPSLAILEPAQRLALHGQVFRRFFLIVWHAMPIVLLSGYALLMWGFGGFKGVHWSVHVMHMTGLIMAVVFVVIALGPWRAMRAALAAGDQAGAAEAAGRVRMLIAVNLGLGLVTVAVAGLG